MLITPSGKPTSSTISMILVWVMGTCSEGLSTKVLPVTTA